MLKRFFCWLFGLIGFVPASNLTIALSDVEAEKNRNMQFQKELSESKQLVNEYERKIQEYQRQAELLQYDTMQQLKSENIRVQEAVKRAEERCKEVESYVTAIMQSDRVFSFAGKPAIPGATVLTVNTDVGVELPDCYRSFSIVGRTILDDVGTKMIHQATTFDDKYRCALQYLKSQTSVIERLMDYVMRVGGIQFTLGYNTDCTEVELYYKMIVGIPTEAFRLETELSSLQDTEERG